MQKIATDDDDPLDREIEFHNVQPNPFARDYPRNRNLRVLSPDLLALFPDSDSVDEALRKGRCEAATESAQMNKSETAPDENMLPHYDFRGGVRGKYARDYGRSENLRVLSPDLLAVFPDSESMNEALRTIVRISSASAPKPKKKKA
jgi:hypothetical protein